MALGAGAYSYVDELNIGDESYAVKIPIKDENSDGDYGNFAEISIMSSLTGMPSIVGIEHIMMTSSISSFIDLREEAANNAYCILMKKGIPLSELATSLDESKKLKIWKRIVIDIAIGLYILHKSRIVHCDIKLDNIIYYGPTEFDEINDDSSFCITDFGIARFYCYKDDAIDIDMIPLHLRPNELYNVKPRLNYFIDIYDLGIMLYEFMYGDIFTESDIPLKNKETFMKMKSNDLKFYVKKIINSKVKKITDKELKQFIESLIADKDRPKASQILELPIFKDYKHLINNKLEKINNTISDYSCYPLTPEILLKYKTFIRNCIQYETIHNNRRLTHHTIVTMVRYLETKEDINSIDISLCTMAVVFICQGLLNSHSNQTPLNNFVKDNVNAFIEMVDDIMNSLDFKIFHVTIYEFQDYTEYEHEKEKEYLNSIISIIS